MIRPAGKRRGAVPLTEARARLFPLVDDLLAGRTDRVALSRRGADQDVLLVRARDIERMEAELAALRRRLAPEPRPLMGYATVVGEVDDILRDIRREADAGFEARLAEIFGDAPAPAAGAPSAGTPSAGTPSAGTPATAPGVVRARAAARGARRRGA